MRPDLSIRASDRERDGVVRLLREQTALGRLTVEEFQDRMGAALAARTWGELRGLLADLPVSARFPDTAGRPQRGRPEDTARRGIDWSGVGFWALFCCPILVGGLAWALQAPAALLLVFTALVLMGVVSVAG